MVPLLPLRGLNRLALMLRIKMALSSRPLLSLCVVGPTSLTSPAPSSPRLKLKRLAPGLVELSSASKKRETRNDDATALLAPGHFSMLGFEALLSSVLGDIAGKEGSFKVLKADVSAQTFVKIGFGVEKELKEGDVVGIPEWRTKPSTVRMHFEVLAKVDGNRIVPEKLVQVNPVVAEDSMAQSALVGSVTVSEMPMIHQPPNPFML